MPKQASLRFAEEAGMNTDPIYEADGKISVRKAVPFGLQHVLAMFVANIAPILIVTGVVKVPASEAGAVVQAAMIIAGIGSLLQMYPVFRLGSGLPVIMGISFTFVSVFCVIGLKYGYGAILGAVLIGGVLEGILGLGAAWWRKLVPPIVSATVVTAIGFSLLPIGANSFGGGFGHPEFGVPGSSLSERLPWFPALFSISAQNLSISSYLFFSGFLWGTLRHTSTVWLI